MKPNPPRKYIQEAILAEELQARGVRTVPKGVPALPALLELSDIQYQLTQAIAKADEEALKRKIQTQPVKNKFKGGVKRVTLKRIGVKLSSSGGFFMLELAACIEVVAGICEQILRDYAGFVEDVSWEEFAIVNQLTQALRQGESTQEAMMRVTKEAKQCCMAASTSSATTLRLMEETLKDYTYKTTDVVPRISTKKRTRL